MADKRLKIVVAVELLTVGLLKEFAINKDQRQTSLRKEVLGLIKLCYNNQKLALIMYIIVN